MKHLKKLVTVLLILAMMTATAVCGFAEKTDPEPRVSIVRPPVIFKIF